MTIFVDPLKSLVDYINIIKPFHSKIYEVSVNYTYDEAIQARIFETFEIQLEDNISETVNIAFDETFVWQQDIFEINEIINVRVTDMTTSSTWNIDTQGWDTTHWNDLGFVWITVTGWINDGNHPPGSAIVPVGSEPWDFGTYSPYP